MENVNARREKTFAVLMLVISLLVLYQAYSYDPESSHFPHFLAWCLLAFSLLNGAKVFKDRIFFPKGSMSEEQKKWVGTAVLVIGATALYTFCIPFFGYYLSTFLFLILLIGYFSRGKNIPLKIKVIGFIAFVGSVFLLFSYFLGTRFPTGSFWEMLNL